jgi:hypothetical protein
MNGTVNPAAPQKGGVGRIDNGIHGELGDVTLINF